MRTVLSVRCKVPLFARVLFSLALLVAALNAGAAPGVTYMGRLLKPDGHPVVASNVQFRLQVRTPLPTNCLMYEEIHTKDLSESAGTFSITLNDGATTPNTEPFTLADAFQNRGVLNFPSTKCTGDDEYTPSASDGRRLLVFFNDGTFGGWEPLPAQDIAFVPMAIESITVGGHKPGNFFRVENGGVPQVLSPWSPASYQKLTDLVGNTTISGGNASIGGNAAGFTGSLSGDVTGGQSSTKVEKIQGRDVLDSAPANGQVLTWNHANSRWEATNLPAAGAPAWNDITGKPSEFPAGGSAGGDLSGNYPNPEIAANAVTGTEIADGAVSPSKLTNGSATGQVLRYDTGSGWAATKLNFMDLVNSIGASPWPTGTCVAGEAIVWESISDGFKCQAISFTETDPKVGANTTNMLSKWNGTALVASGVYESGGNVGIGTTSPSHLLNIVNPTGGASVRLGKNWTNEGGFLGSNYMDNLALGAGVEFNGTTHTARASSASQIWMDSGNIYFRADGTVTTGATYTPSHRMVISGFTGNVGIGTTNPGDKLHVEGKIRAQEICDEAGANCKDISGGWGGGGDFMKDGSVAMTGGLDLYNGTNLSPGLRFANDTNTGIFQTSGSNDTLSIATGGAERVRVDATGNVGIGTTTPATKLHVVGPITIGNGGAERSLIFNYMGNQRYGLRTENGGLRFDSEGGGTWNEVMAVVGNNVGVGTAAPSAKFHIVGTTGSTLRIVDGTQGANKVLTSDANGVASWQTPAASGLTSVGLTMPSVFTVTGSPLTGNGTLAVSANGTSGGIPYFASTTTMASSAALTQYGLVVGGGAGAAPTSLAAGSTGTILTGQGSANPSFSATPTLGVAGSAIGRLSLAGNTSGAVTIQPQAAAGTYNFNLPTSAGTSGQALLSGGGGSTAMTFGTLGVGAGGTGLTSGTSGGIPYFSSSSAMASSGALGQYQVLLGGGAGAAPTVVSGVGTTGQVLTSNGAGAAPTWQAAFSGVTGSGTSGYLPKFTGASSVGNSTVYDSSGNIGIGTTSPSFKLDVQSSTAGDGVRVWNVNGPGVTFSDTVGYSFRIAMPASSGSDGRLRFLAGSNTEVMSIQNSGNVGIGTTNPTSNLHIEKSQNGDTSMYLFNPDDVNPNARSIFLIGNGSAGGNYGYLAHKGNGHAMPNETMLVGADTNGLRLVGQGTGLRLENSGGEVMRINSSGNVGIGTTSPSEKLHVVGNVMADAYLMSSDRRLKTEIKTSPGLELILKLRGTKYIRKSTGKPEYGVIAQEVEAIAPELVVTDPRNGMKAVHYQNLISPLIESTKETQAQIDQLKTENQDLRRELHELREMVQTMQQQRRMPAGQ